MNVSSHYAVLGKLFADSCEADSRYPLWPSWAEYISVRRYLEGRIEMNEDRARVSLTVITGTGREFFGAIGRQSR